MTDALRGPLERAEAADELERLLVLATLAGADMTIPEDEARPAIRRAQLLLATGGSPFRELDIDGRAVTALADDLATPERAATLGAGLSSLASTAAGLPAVGLALAGLHEEPDLAWRAYALSLLAASLDDDAGEDQRLDAS